MYMHDRCNTLRLWVRWKANYKLPWLESKTHGQTDSARLFTHQSARAQHTTAKALNCKKLARRAAVCPVAHLVVHADVASHPVRDIDALGMSELPGPRLEGVGL